MNVTPKWWANKLPIHIFCSCPISLAANFQFDFHVTTFSLFISFLFVCLFVGFFCVKSSQAACLSVGFSGLLMVFYIMEAFLLGSVSKTNISIMPSYNYSSFTNTKQSHYRKLNINSSLGSVCGAGDRYWLTFTQLTLEIQRAGCSNVGQRYPPDKSLSDPVISTVKPLLSLHLRDLHKCPLNRRNPLNKVCKNCAMFVND